MKRPLSVLVLAATPLAAAPTFTTDAGGGSTTDLFDVSQGARTILSTQVLPFADARALPLYYAFEKTVYDALG